MELHEMPTDSRRVGMLNVELDDQLAVVVEVASFYPLVLGRVVITDEGDQVLQAAVATTPVET